MEVSIRQGWDFVWIYASVSDQCPFCLSGHNQQPQKINMVPTAYRTAPWGLLRRRQQHRVNSQLSSQSVTLSLQKIYNRPKGDL